MTHIYSKGHLILAVAQGKMVTSSRLKCSDKKPHADRCATEGKWFHKLYFLQAAQ
jgi:hypothetical protein